MVSLSDVQFSNSRIASTLPARLVAVFVGATNGIGEYTLKQFAKHTQQPRVYFVGRSQEAADRIVAECKALNSKGEFFFVKADVGLIGTVDDVCRDIKSKEMSINLLFLNQGTLVAGIKTAEGLHLATALTLHSRARFIVNLLPLLQRATALRRVVSVFAATLEGPIDLTDIQGWNVNLLTQHGPAASLVTLSMKTLAKKAPNVSFIHDFPGPVQSGIARGPGVGLFVIRIIFMVLGPIMFIPKQESGERHLFLATSAKYPAGASGDSTSGVPLPDGVVVARGTDGKLGSGMYSVDQNVESAGSKVEELLASFRKEGMPEKVWELIEGEFKRITGPAAV